MMKLSDLKAGDRIIADEGFTCLPVGPHVVKDYNGELYVDCSCGKHMLDGQLDFTDCETIIGFSKE